MTTLDPRFLSTLDADPAYATPLTEEQMVAALKVATTSAVALATLIVEVRRLRALLDRACDELDVLGSKQADRIRADGGTGGGPFSLRAKVQR